MRQRLFFQIKGPIAAFFVNRPWILFYVLGFLLIFPALLRPDLLLGWDGQAHVNWQAAFSREFWKGHLYPRWLPEMNGGFGSPSFIFYPPILQWTGALFGAIMPGEASSIQRISLALAVLAIIGAFGCRAWILILKGSENAGVLAGALWLTTPYFAFIDIYHRSALAECVAYCILPWLAFCAVRVADARRGSWGLHAVAIGVLVYAHLPGMVIGYLFVAGHGLALVLAEKDAGARARLMFSLGTSALVGLIIAGAMLVPALALLRFIVNTDPMSGEYMQPRNWLLMSGRPWMENSIRVMTIATISLTAIITAFLTLPAISKAKSLAQYRAVSLAMTVTVIVVSLLNFEIARPLWELQTPLSRIQFPFRLLGASSLAVCILAGSAYDFYFASNRVFKARALWTLVVAFLVIDAALLIHKLDALHKHPAKTLAQVLTNNDTDEYVLGNLAGLEKQFGARLAFSPMDPSLLIELASIGNRHATVRYWAQRDTTIALRQFNFTGWECRVDDGPWYSAATLESSSSLHNPPAKVPTCAVQQGEHQLETRMAVSREEQLGYWLTLAGLVIVAGSFLWPVKVFLRGRSLEEVPDTQYQIDGYVR